jgi:hypothetical protein
MQGMKEESSHNPQLDNPTKISMYLKGKGNHLREQAPSIWSLTVNQCRKHKEVAHFVTSHNQKQQQKQSNHKTQTAANRPQEVVCTEPKTTTNKQKTTLQTNSSSMQKPIEAILHRHLQTI